MPVYRRVHAVDKMNIQTIDSCFSACSIGLLEWSYGAMLVQLAIRPARLASNDFGNSNELQVAQRTKEPNLCQTCVCVPISLSFEHVGKLGVCMCFVFDDTYPTKSKDLQEGLMPKIVSGVSGGSIVAGFLAIHTDEEKLGWIWAGRCQKSLIRNREVRSYSPRFRSAHRSDVTVISYSGTWKLWLGREPLYKGMRHDSMWKQRLFKFISIWGKVLQKWYSACCKLGWNHNQIGARDGRLVLTRLDPTTSYKVGPYQL